MKHNTCPHCGARISLRQRLFPKKNGIHCAHCGRVCYLMPGASWSFVYASFFCLSMAVQHWYRLPWWVSAVVVAVIVPVLIALSPLRQTHEFTRREKTRQLVIGVFFFIAYFFLSEWVLAHRPAVWAPTMPPAAQSAS